MGIHPRLGSVVYPSLVSIQRHIEQHLGMVVAQSPELAFPNSPEWGLDQAAQLDPRKNTPPVPRAGIPARSGATVTVVRDYTGGNVRSHIEPPPRWTVHLHVGRIRNRRRQY